MEYFISKYTSEQIESFFDKINSLGDGDIDRTLYKLVDELPDKDIDSTKIYLIPSSDPTSENAYDEYIHVDGSWEFLGKKIDIDLDNYATNEDLEEVKKSVEEINAIPIEDIENIFNQ